MINLEEKKEKGFWQDTLELMLDICCLPFKLVVLFFKGLWLLIKGVGYAVLFLLETFFEIIGEIIGGLF